MMHFKKALACASCNLKYTHTMNYILKTFLHICISEVLHLFSVLFVLCDNHGETGYVFYYTAAFGYFSNSFELQLKLAKVKHLPK